MQMFVSISMQIYYLHLGHIVPLCMHAYAGQPTVKSINQYIAHCLGLLRVAEGTLQRDARTG